LAGSKSGAAEAIDGHNFYIEPQGLRAVRTILTTPDRVNRLAVTTCRTAIINAAAHGAVS